MTVPLDRQKNIADVATRVRDQLGLRGSAVLDVGTAAGTVAAGDDGRITGALQSKDNPWILASEYGVKGDGVTDDTAALNAAFAAAEPKYKTVLLPPGNIIYNGTGWNFSHPAIEGTNRPGTVVILGPNSRLVNSDQPWGGLLVKNLTTVGGKGAIRNTFTGVNVAGKFFVQSCSFRDYTSACIEANANDMPYWFIEGNIFNGANYTTAIGIALLGWFDSGRIESNGFLANKIHIKLGRSAQNAYLRGNDFLRFGPGDQRIDIWIVPVNEAEYLVSGQGFVLRDCKFGNENLDPSDMAILYADEGPGATVGERMPSFAQSSGVISGQKIADCAIFGIGNNSTRSLVYSTTSEIRGGAYGDISIGGTPPKYLVELAYAATSSIYNQNNIVGPARFQDQQAATYQEFRLTNSPSLFVLNDVTRVSARSDFMSVLPEPVKSSTGLEDYEPLFTGSFTAGATVGSTAISIADAYSGNDALELTITTSGGYLAVPFSVQPVAGKPAWFDVNYAAGSTSSVGNIFVRIRNLTTDALEFVEYLKLPPSATDWKEARFLWVPRSQPAAGFRIEIGAASLGNMRLSRVRAYQARQPLPGGVLRDINFIPNGTSIPTVNPVGGGYMNVENGALKWRGSSGTVTTVASA